MKKAIMGHRCYKCNQLIENTNYWYGLHHACFMQWFDLSSLEQFQQIASKQQSEGRPETFGVNSTFFHGKFRKYSALLGKNKYILKVEQHEYPELPAMEYLCNQMFKSFGLEIPPFYLIRFEQEHTCFVTENFMGRLSESNLVHIYHFLNKNMNYDCENLLRIIGETTGRISAQEDFIYLTLADSLIGNNDRHGRNLALIQSSKGYVLAPIYDNVSYIGIELASLLDADHQPAGAIGTMHFAEPTMTHYIQEWERLGFEYVVDRFRKTVSLNGIQDLVMKSYLTPKRQEALMRVINKRSKELWQ